jgi:hypothetical protein
MTIETLPDYPSLEQLANALWRKGTARGAAVLVGAGFSKYAERPGPDTPEPPLWGELATEMARQLYRLTPANAPEPLRLAEEFRTNFGQAALDEFVRMHIPDSAWEPGPLHRQLLSLPWSDVLTTNWDTLLERASNDVSVQSYDVVRLTADLPHVRAPRIVKLHGTIGASDHFIIAEEDYRTYPARFAPFVNLARQVFIENELCLLGFSGDDPNFLQWSGWVRDQLGEGSRRIYLVGTLRLEPTTRKFLEARNIAPIDLHPLVRDRDESEGRAAATKLFLDFLADMKPKSATDWRPAGLSAYGFLSTLPTDIQQLARDHRRAATLLDQAADVWRADREAYPGWLVCPARLRAELRSNTDFLGLLRQPSLDNLEPKRRAEILYELAWRCATAFWPIDPQRAALLAAAVDPPMPGLAKNKQIEIAVLLLHAARQSHDEAAFTRWAGFLDARAAPETDLAAEVAYQRCLHASNRLDLEAVVNELHKVAGPDPIWRLRRASLHAEIGEFGETAKLIIEANDELARRQRRDRHSLWVRSRRAWTAWLLPATRIDRFNGRDHDDDSWEFKEAGCDPANEIHYIENEAEASLRRRREEEAPVVVLFEAGHYRDPSRVVRFRSNAIVKSIDTLDQLMEVVGLPMRLNYYDMVGNAAWPALELAFEPTFSWYAWFLRWIQGPSDSQIQRYFGRMALAQLSPHVTGELTRRSTAMVAFWRRRLGGQSERPADTARALDRLRLFIAALSRLTVRQDATGAEASFALAIELAGDPKIRHPLVVEGISDLFKYSAQAVPPSRRTLLILPALELSLSSEARTDAHRWPNPIQLFWTLPPDRPTEDGRWAARIQQLIQAAMDGQPAREEAILRLAYLAKHDVLTAAERQAFGQALWSEIEKAAMPLPERTGRLINMFATLPAPENINAEERVRTRLFEANPAEFLSVSTPFSSETGAGSVNYLRSFIGAAQDNLLPTPEQAVRLFDQITAWRPSRPDNIDPWNESLLRSFHDAIRSPAGDTLALAIAPAMRAVDRTKARANALLELIAAASVKRARAALPYFAGAADTAAAEIVQAIRRGLIGPTFEDLAGAAAAIETWIRLEATGAASALPEQLVEQAISGVETRRETGLHYLLQCSRRLAEANKLTSAHHARLSDALGDLLAETAYATIDPESREAVSVSLIRAECIRLARTLEDLGAGGQNPSAWLLAAAADPLPEVRFALIDIGQA